MTAIPRSSVAEVLACLGDEFSAFAAGFCQGEYALWLGSGISRNVVPNTPALLENMLEFLRSRINPGDPNCRFRAAFEDILDVAAIPPSTRASITYTTPVVTWPAAEDIVGRLVDRYSDVLNVQVRGESADFLVWTGLNVASTYGSPNLQPDAEHVCVAILMLEGVVTSALTANWDGLVEAAMGSLTDNRDHSLKVVVRAQDFREPKRQAELVKFHGCAVRAALDESKYRDGLIARKAQISGWAVRSENELMKKYLEHIFATRSAFIVGLSAQDADIHAIFHRAIENLSRHWPISPPPVVFAEQSLHYHHRHVLQVTYGTSYGSNADDIEREALLGAFAKPALIALVLFVLTEKLCELISSVSELSISGADLELIRADIRQLRDTASSYADADPCAFVDMIVLSMSFLLSTFRTGAVPDPTHLVYQQISVNPIATAVDNPDFPGAALGRLAIAVSLLGRGVAEGSWDLELGTPQTPDQGVMRVVRPRETSRLFIVSNSRSLAQLEVAGVVDLGDGDVVVIQAVASEPPSVRTPGTHYGRTGVAQARRVDFERLCATVNTAGDLFSGFKLEAAL